VPGVFSETNREGGITAFVGIMALLDIFAIRWILMIYGIIRLCKLYTTAGIYCNNAFLLTSIFKYFQNTFAFDYMLPHTS